MGARTIRRRDRTAGRKRERLSFWVTAAVIVLPIILAIALVGTDMRADLSDLKPVSQLDNRGTVPVAWVGLERARRRFRSRPHDRLHDKRKTGQRDGTAVSSFVLLPEAGQFLHPAHRIRNQSVVVWASKPVVFRYWQLVWASGALSRTIRRSRD